MTYRKLKEELAKLNEEQLEQTVTVTGEDRSVNIGEVWALEEDYINPTGVGMEPRSAYQSDDEDEDDYADSNEPIVATKGRVFLVEEA
jgi:hypothetical protein